MNFKTTLMLLVLLILAGGVVMLLQQTPPSQTPGRTAAAGGGQPIFEDQPFTVDNIHRLTVTLDDGRSAVFEREADGWWQTQPTRFAVIGVDVRGALAAAAGLRWVERFEPAAGRGAAGDGNGDEYSETKSEAKSQMPTLDRLQLAPPRATLRLEGAMTNANAASNAAADTATITHEIHLGRSVGGRLYVRVDDDPSVYVVANDLDARLSSDRSNQPLLAAWRVRTLDGPDAASVHRLLIRNGREIIELTRHEGGWNFAAPNVDRVDSDAASRLLASLVSIQVNRFIDDAPTDPTAFGLGDPTVEVAVTSTVAISGAHDNEGEGETSTTSSRAATLSIGAPVDLEGSAYYATFKDHRHDGRAVFTLSKNIVEALRVGTDDFRDRRLTPAAAADITAVHVTRSRPLDAENIVEDATEAVADADTGANAATPAIQEPIEDAFELTRELDGWRLARTPRLPLDPAAVRSLLGAITDTRATGFAAADQITSPPLATMAVTTLGGDATAAERLRIYPFEHPHTGTDTAQHADTSGPRYLVVRHDERIGRVVSAAALAPLFEPVDTLQSRMLIERDRDSLAHLTISGHSVDVTWTAPTPATQPVDEEAEANTDPAVQAVLDALLPLRAEHWLTDTDAEAEAGAEAGTDAEAGEPAAMDTARTLTLEMVFTDQSTRRLRVDIGSGRAQLDDAPLAFMSHPALLDALRALADAPAPL